MTTPVTLAPAAHGGRPEALLSVRGLTKVYGGSYALNEVAIEVRRGEIHALCGGNGSGKSTLIKVLCGVVPGDAGTVTVDDAKLDVHQMGPKHMHQLGIRVVHQDLAIFPDLSVAENMVLGGDYPTRPGGAVNWREIRAAAERAIRQFSIPASPEDIVNTLPVATRAQIAIARACRDVEIGSGLLILDEATAALPVREVGILHDTVRRLAEAGHSILFITHRLDEVMDLSHRVTVLRDGRVVTTHETSKLTEPELIDSILGSRVREVSGHPVSGTVGDPLLEVEGLSAGPLSDVSLRIMPGEVLGVAGLLGSGRTELLRTLCGDLKRRGGSVRLNGREANFASLGDAIKRRVAFIPEDRVTDGIFPDMSLAENLDVSVLGRYWRLSGFRRTALRRDARELKQRFRIKAPSIAVEMSALSGGNQQKAVLARWLRRDPLLLLLDEPTQGVDVGARADIYTAVREVTGRGGGALVVTSDLEELAQVVDRAVVLVNGRIVAHVPREELSAQYLSELIYRKGRNHA